VGLKTTFLQTKAVPQVWIEIITKKIKKEPTPNVQFVGPVGLGSIMNKALQYGAGNYLMLIAVIAIYLAIFNLLPLPALDGGRLLFLVVEAIRKKPIEPKIEQQATAVFFVLFIMLGLFLTIQDIWRLF
jgi:regulator of sigma E protease